MPDTTTLDPTPPGGDPAPASPRRRRVSLVAAGVAFAAITAFWAWILVYQLQNRGEEDMPDRLDDLSWTAEADRVCAATTERVAELPPAHTSPTADARADVIEEATAEIELMLQELEGLAPADGSRDADITADWIADYRIFLQDRLRFADSLREDPGAQFLVTEKYGSHITKPIDRFARVNEMEACMSPGDV
ncbi:hypothetical protein [Actinomarinicola tropica]|uniref:Uncharacterized protein n=1 Tax=Actinomarinicola tropica TaxID=2789776 RepID=A0A5Q2RJW7_9ACTN|nr:hypothetical protein [Actinomarinicola tropica]QGG95212.1 hypothetical protein GH723_08945 [Actinomarinicola tropica]